MNCCHWRRASMPGRRPRPTWSASTNSARRRPALPASPIRPAAGIFAGDMIPGMKPAKAAGGPMCTRTGDALGVLARLKISGAELVPARHRRHVDAILHRTARQCPAAWHRGSSSGVSRPTSPQPDRSPSRSATGRRGHRDDGARRRRRLRCGSHRSRCRASGLLTEATLGKRNRADLMGLIFSPNFTTEGLARTTRARPRHGARSAGPSRVSVARSRSRTKRHRYTLFTIRLPAPNSGQPPASSDRAHAALLTRHCAGECNVPERIRGVACIWWIRPCFSRQRVAASDAT